MEHKDISFKLGDFKINIRVAIFLTNRNRVLLHRVDKLNYMNMPGGRMQSGENSLQAIKREIKEELNLDLLNPQLIHIAENFFNIKGENYHELLFIYKQEIDDSYEITKKQNFMTLDHDNELNYWIEIENLKNYKCLPEIIYEIPNETTLTHTIKVD